MNEERIKKLINYVATATVIKLKKSGMIKQDKKSSFKKTEELLKNYNKFKAAIVSNKDNTYKTQIVLNIIDETLKSFESDPYGSIIDMYFFQNKTLEDIAEYYNVEIRTVRRNKNRLVNDLNIALFSDEVIEELFL